MADATLMQIMHLLHTYMLQISMKLDLVDIFLSMTKWPKLDFIGKSRGKCDIDETISSQVSDSIPCS
jgi:hypothetical protein